MARRDGVPTFTPYSTVLDPIRSQSINMINDDFISGYEHDGRMSVIRRFFCLFVTFDLAFIALLWLISVVITGDNIYNAFQKQVLHYTIYSSLFDIVGAAIIRFLTLIIFYAICYVNHWSVIALSTTGSCTFLISKVFLYDWSSNPQPIFQVVLILTSFILAWGEAWFLDCRVIPQEKYARAYYQRFNSTTVDERTPLVGTSRGNVDSIAAYYSPIASILGSDDEEEKDEEYKRLGLECIRKAFLLVEAEDWKQEKVTSVGDEISSIQQAGLGKVFKLTATLNCQAGKLIYDLFTQVEEVPLWNKALLESKIIHKIDYFTDITYQASVGGGGGIVKSRDFVNLRCYKVFENGKMMNDFEMQSQVHTTVQKRISSLSTVHEQSESESSVKSESCILPKLDQELYQKQQPYLSSSMGGKMFSTINEKAEKTSQDNDEDIASFVDVDTERVHITAARSIVYPGYESSTKYIRGENLISSFVAKEVPFHENQCIFEWILCLDLKGYIPSYVLDTAYKTLMQDYMVCLRKKFETKKG